MHWDMVIGLEVHVQLNTKSKLFSGSATQFGAKPNSQVSFIDIALPGTLPVINKEAINKAIIFGLAVNGHINQTNYFERKNYFYPDLPKGYQTSQLARPVIEGGHLRIDCEGQTKEVTLTRAHLEEDAGKSIHLTDSSGIDLNRAGIPLLEVVTEPVIYSAKEAVAYLKTLNHLVQHIGICSGNMQEGAFRVDVNLSVKPKDTKKLGTRVEIKNLNSFRFIEKAIHYEASRHINCLESKEPILQETRLFDEKSGQTKSMRSKEEAHDYRYFPCPDLPPIHISEHWIEKIRKSMQELPDKLLKRLIKTYGISEDDAYFLLKNKGFSEYFEAVVNTNNTLTTLAINWLKGEVSAVLNKETLLIEEINISPSMLGELLESIQAEVISNNVAKKVFSRMWQSGESAKTIIAHEGLAQTNDSTEIETIIQTIINQNPDQVEQFIAGKTKLLGFFVGKVMKETKGKANPKIINQLLQKALDKLR